MLSLSQIVLSEKVILGTEDQREMCTMPLDQSYHLCEKLSIGFFRSIKMDIDNSLHRPR